MKVEIAERPPVKVFYLRYTGPFGEPLGKFWRSDVTVWLADHGLLDWVRDYETRDDVYSLSGHRWLFDWFSGVKREFTA